jgi:hypothetical protein
LKIAGNLENAEMYNTVIVSSKAALRLQTEDTWKIDIVSDCGKQANMLCLFLAIRVPCFNFYSKG